METNQIIAVLILRLILGALFFFQGYDKMFNLGLKEVASAFSLHNKMHVPGFLVSIFVFITSYVELIGGAMLILGLFKSQVLYFLGFDLVVACIGFSMIRPMWDMQHVFPRLVILILLLLLPQEWDILSLDKLF